MSTAEPETSAPLSIGEVLSVLTEEFPDVTISKIRFLESQGLVCPERNASGYRQFSDGDVERLRWILRQQRDHFLPLKVIKKALDSGVELVDAGSDQPTLWTALADEAAEQAAGAPDETTDETPVEANDGQPGDKPNQQSPEQRAEPQAPRHATPADVVAALQEDPRKPKEPGRSTATSAPVEPPPPAEVVEVPAGQLTHAELLDASGLDEDYLAALVEFGLLAPRDVGGEPTYDDTDLVVCRAAARCAVLGVGPRHLRIYKVAAVREAGLVEQVVMPLLKQRNPEGRMQAAETAAELAELGADVHAALLRRELGPDIARQR